MSNLRILQVCSVQYAKIAFIQYISYIIMTLKQKMDNTVHLKPQCNYSALEVIMLYQNGRNQLWTKEWQIIAYEKLVLCTMYRTLQSVISDI